jgi:hypothetical protein
MCVIDMLTAWVFVDAQLNVAMPILTQAVDMGLARLNTQH